MDFFPDFPALGRSSPCVTIETGSEGSWLGIRRESIEKDLPDCGCHVSALVLQLLYVDPHVSDCFCSRERLLQALRRTRIIEHDSIRQMLGVIRSDELHGAIYVPLADSGTVGVVCRPDFLLDVLILSAK